MKFFNQNTSFYQPDRKKGVFYAFPYHVGGCTLNVTFNYLKFDGWKELLIGSILSTHTAVLSLMGLTHGLSLWTFLFITFDAQQAHWLNLIN